LVGFSRTRGLEAAACLVLFETLRMDLHAVEDATALTLHMALPRGRRNRGMIADMIVDTVDEQIEVIQNFRY
jgi:hypothetical protein